MPNGGAAWFESGKGLRRIKHHCFSIGIGLSRRKDPLTRDLFDDEPGDELQDGSAV
jgi:hypothetical protein